MKIIIAIGFLFICACDYVSADCDKIYVGVGAGYKFQERTKVTVGSIDYETEAQSPISARLELGVQCSKFNFGVTHRSQWLEGAPFNDDREYSVTELFVEYRHYWDI